ncbi:glutamic acid-rich protein [Solenopsis invicta]|uniref:glutamic acid-rich protein n=1 Tax=Solenopsis invicta TaxID=13686 RepID=UPI00193DDD68|nr:glutamic acid-rich protein [Solenopsis invicta]
MSGRKTHGKKIKKTERDLDAELDKEIQEGMRGIEIDENVIEKGEETEEEIEEEEEEEEKKNKKKKRGGRLLKERNVIYGKPRGYK